MKMKKLFAGIDIGGTSIKTVIINEDLKRRAFAKVPTDKAYKVIDGKRYITGPQRGIDAEMLWKLVKESFSKAIVQLEEDEQILSIAVSTFGCTMLLFDENGSQIDMYIEDALIEEEVRYYRSLYSEEEFFEITGYPLEKGTVLFNLSAFGRSRAVNTPLRILSAEDYIIYRFCGEMVRSRSLAYSCGAWDWKNKCWLNTFLKRSGLSEEYFGSPIDSGMPVGVMEKDVAAEFGLTYSPMISTGGHDYEVAAFAVHPLLCNGVMNITGTVDLIAYFDSDASDHRSEPYRMMRDAHVIGGMNSHMVETLGAVQTEWLKGITVSPDENLSWDDFFAEMAETIGKGRSELFIPRIFGSSFPRMREEEKGAYLGLGRTTRRGDLLRAMLEGMCFQAKMMLEKLSADAKSFNHVVLLGGASHDDVWTQLKCDILGLPIVVPEQREASAFGAALLASVGCGTFSMEKVVEKLSDQPCKKYFPDKDRSRFYEDFYHSVWLPVASFCEENDQRTKVFFQRNRGGADA